MGLTTLKVAAQTAAPTGYWPLTPLPGMDPTQPVKAEDYINSIFSILIGLAGVLAVVMIIYGGIQYMSTDAFSGKSEAKSTIQNAFLGLGLAIASYLILNTINPDLVNIKINIPTQTIPGKTTPPAGPTGSCAGCTPLGSLFTNGNACKKVNPGDVCQVSSSIYGALTQFNTNFPGFLTITEAWPPTSDKHTCACHYSGTCVDARAVPDVIVYNYIKAAEGSGLRAVFEIPATVPPQVAQTRKSRIIEASCGGSTQTKVKDFDPAVCRALLNTKIVIPANVKTEHFSLYTGATCQ